MASNLVNVNDKEISELELMLGEIEQRLLWAKAAVEEANATDPTHHIYQKRLDVSRVRRCMIAVKALARTTYQITEEIEKQAKEAKI